METRTHSLPSMAGVGLKPQHVAAVLGTRPDLGFFEVHAENYMVPGGRFHRDLDAIAAHYPLSIHGVGLSIGGADALDRAHLERLKLLLERHRPALFSEHLAWSSHGGHFYNDLLPVAYTRHSLQRVCAHIDQVQDTLGRTLLLENPSTYLTCLQSTMGEGEFLAEVVRRSGCDLLLDVNNVHVSCINHGLDPLAYLQTLPLDRVQEIHVAGFAEEIDETGQPLLIDTHGAPIAQAVWDLFDRALQMLGRPVPTLIERDNNIPAWPVLLAEAQQAQARLLAMETA
jgi:uncharacterized protein